jgi:hypothetical protein
MVNNVRVWSLSFGNYSRSGLEQALLARADSLGIFVLGGAGNDGSEDVFYPTGYPTVIAVAATNSANNRAGFSNHGSWVGISAPGEYIYSTYPRISSENGYKHASGTSMATPAAAGAASLITGMWQDSSLAFRKERLFAGAVPIDDAAFRDVKMGTGCVNAERSLFMPYFPKIELISFSIKDAEEEHR